MIARNRVDCYWYLERKIKQGVNMLSINFCITPPPPIPDQAGRDTPRTAQHHKKKTHFCIERVNWLPEIGPIDDEVLRWWQLLQKKWLMVTRPIPYQGFKSSQFDKYFFKAKISNAAKWQAEQNKSKFSAIAVDNGNFNATRPKTNRDKKNPALMKSIKAEARAFRQTELTESSTGHVEARKSKIAPCPTEWLHINDE